ncbi:MAG: amidohydrolase family protein [Solirubrobacteraceae bacterium]|jgi:predicted TIM-barrel fold metal-dependent hydrolase
MRLITLEEHYRAPMVQESSPAQGFDEAMSLSPDTPLGKRLAKLDDIGRARLQDMDAAGIDVQVPSHTVPATEQFQPEQAVPLAQAANDYLAKAIAPHPDRFAAFATLPTPAPQAAADELERAVTALGFRGALINGHTQVASSTTDPSGRSWNEHSASACPSTFIPANHQPPSARPTTAGCPLRQPRCSPQQDRAGM